MTADIDNPEPLPDTGMTADTEREWLDLRAASKASGLSISALRKRYREGRLTSRTVPGPTGEKREVDYLELKASRRPGPSTGPVPPSAGLIPLTAYEAIHLAYLDAQKRAADEEVGRRIAEHDLARAKGELDRLAEEAARAREELDRVRAELDAARARRRRWGRKAWAPPTA
jgi:hypothetical protein